MVYESATEIYKGYRIELVAGYSKGGYIWAYDVKLSDASLCNAPFNSKDEALADAKQAIDALKVAEV